MAHIIGVRRAYTAAMIRCRCLSVDAGRAKVGVPELALQWIAPLAEARAEALGLQGRPARDRRGHANRIRSRAAPAARPWLPLLVPQRQRDVRHWFSGR